MVIFTIHWGPNMRVRPMPNFREFARAVLDAGADVFWGHSAHLVQGIEIYKGKPILYDTGDFIDDYTVDEWERNDLSALFLVNIITPVVHSLELVPVRISNMQVNLATGLDREWFTKRVMRLCQEMGTEIVSGPDRLHIELPSLSKVQTSRGQRKP